MITFKANHNDGCVDVGGHLGGVTLKITPFWNTQERDRLNLEVTASGANGEELLDRIVSIVQQGHHSRIHETHIYERYVDAARGADRATLHAKESTTFTDSMALEAVVAGIDPQGDKKEVRDMQKQLFDAVMEVTDEPKRWSNVALDREYPKESAMVRTAKPSRDPDSPIIVHP